MATRTSTRSLPVLPPPSPPRGDLTRAPVLGRFLRWKHARTAVQVPLLVLAAIIIADGFFGPRAAPENAAGVAPWIQWRGLVVLALLVVGNLFCMACPFMLPRRLAKRLLPADRAWPAALRPKWLALALLVLFLWGYEAFDLWASPWLTAWLVLSYFFAAFVIDGFFRGAAFCKNVCPIGSFNFVNSLVSPGEVRVRDPDVCAACETKDCIAGRYDGDRLVQSGCELWLFQPRKIGNLDCTFCLDCVQACPHGNVGLVARLPGAELIRDRWRSGIGHLADRPDLAALAMIVVFAAFVNAAGMIGPTQETQAWLGRLVGTDARVVGWTLFLILALGVLPALLLAATTAASHHLGGGDTSPRRLLLRMAYGLVPLGFGMWFAHYAFHFLASGLNLVPVLHRVAGDVGLAGGAPDWSLGPMIAAGWLIPLELLFIELGLLVSLVLLYRIARTTFPSGRQARRALAPWAFLAIGLSLAGAWIMTQPMEMRGMMNMPGHTMPGHGAPVHEQPEHGATGHEHHAPGDEHGHEH
jgi:NAD-dependent dihydropyrimidine dehydrogenase PreA subunit